MTAFFKVKVDVDEITRIFFNRIYALWVISLNQICILNHSWFDFCFVCLFVCILQLKLQGSPSVGLEVSVCSHFPTTPVHTVLHVYKWGGGGGGYPVWHTQNWYIGIQSFFLALTLLQFPQILSDCVCGEEWVWSCARPLFPLCLCYSSPGSCLTVYVGRSECDPVWDLYSHSAFVTVLQDPVWLCMWGGVSVILCETFIPTLPLLQFSRILSDCVRGEEWVWSCVRPLFPLCLCYSSPGSCLCMWGGVSVILCETFIPALPLLQFPRILSDCVCGEEWVWSCVRPLFPLCPCYSSPGSCKSVERVDVILCETIFIPVLLSLQFPRILPDCVCGENGCYPVWDHIYSDSAVDTVPLDPVRLCVWGAGPGQPRGVPRSLQACGHCQPQERGRSPGQVSATSLPECLCGVFTQFVCTVSWGVWWGGGGGGHIFFFFFYTLRWSQVWAVIIRSVCPSACVLCIYGWRGIKNWLFI